MAESLVNEVVRPVAEPQRPFDFRRAQSWAAPALKALSVVLLLGSTLMLEYVARTGQFPYSDFDLYYFAGAVERHGSYTETARVVAMAHAAGRPVSPAGAYGSPSLIGLFFQPLSFVALSVAHVVWDVLAIGGAVLAMRKAAGRQWMLWTAVLFTTFSVGLTNRWANAHWLTLALIVYSYGALKADQDTRAGLALGLAVAAKIYPGFLILPLLLSRRWNAAKTAIAVVVALALVTVPALGIHDTSTAIRAQTSLGSSVSTIVGNVGLPSFVLAHSHNATMARAATAVLLMAGTALLIGLRRRRVDELFGVAIVVMLLAQPISWAYYASLLIVPLLALSESQRPRLFLLGLAGFGLACVPGYTTLRALGLDLDPPFRFTIAWGTVLVLAAGVFGSRTRATAEGATS